LKNRCSLSYITLPPEGVRKILRNIREESEPVLVKRNGLFYFLPKEEVFDRDNRS
jgi:hypothetical protein